MDLPPSPLTQPQETAPPSPWTAGWPQTLAAALVLPVVGYGLLSGYAWLLSWWVRHPLWSGPVWTHAPAWLQTAFTLGAVFGLIPGALVALIDRKRPYAAAAVVPMAFGLVGVLLTIPDFTAAAMVLGGALGVWACESGGIALTRPALRRWRCAALDASYVT